MFSRVSIAALLIAWCPVFAQNNSQAPVFTLPFAAHQGLFSPLFEEPHIVEVRQITTDANGFSLKLSRGGGGEMTFSQNASVPTSESKFVSHLKVGRRYLFPHCVIDTLGLQPTIQIIRMHGGKPLASLSGSRPFRAVVLDQGLGDSTYSVILQEAGGRIHHLQGRFDEHPDVRSVALHLSRGRSVEFPAVLEDALLTKEQRVERAKPENEGAAVLYRYLGEWRGGMDSNPKAKIEMVCHARPDGSGIWREITFRDGGADVPALPDINIVEYDRASQVYLAGSLAPGSPPPLRSTWDEKTRTFTTTLPANEGGLQRVNTATFTREDRIDWKTISRAQNGQVVSTSTGHYDRVHGPWNEEDVPQVPTPLLETKVSSQAAQPLAPPSFTGTVEKLASCPAFRAKVIFIEVQNDEVTIELLHTSGDQKKLFEKIPGIGTSDLGKALSALEKGETYEFPFCIQHPGQTPVEEPATPEMKALKHFIGNWKAFSKQQDGSFTPRGTSARYFWSANGAALWREMTYPKIDPLTGKPLPGPTTKHLDLITYDAEAKCYVEAEEHALPSVRERPAKWDAAKNSYHWQSDVQHMRPRKAEGVRHIVSADRIDYEARHLSVNGALEGEETGYYERIKD